MMHRSRLWIVTPVLTALVLLINFTKTSAAYDSGSTGADGAFNPTVTTAVDLPPNGVFNFTTVNIPSGVTVYFNRNAANTPVTFLATGNVTIGGTLSVTANGANGRTPGKGGPGGFDGGIGAYPTFYGQMGLGPGGGGGAWGTNNTPSVGSGGGGAGHASVGGAGTSYNNPYNYASSTGGATYSNVEILPLIGGSGGGGGYASNTSSAGAGGGGGGAILIASSGTITVTGSITASGGPGGGYGQSAGGGGGSGGAIKLIADVIAGDGTISAAGGSGAYRGGSGGNGRIRFEANSLLRNVSTSPLYSYQAAPGPVTPPGNPTLSISSIGGVPVPAASAGSYSTPDILFGAGVTNPVSIVIQASNIPAGTEVVVTNVPEKGTASSASALLAGTDTESTASVNMTLSTQYTNVIMVKATISLVVTAGLIGETPLYADGERVIKMMVTAIPGAKSTVTYITESGREFAGIM